MIAGYAGDGVHHAFLVCVTNDLLHLEPVVVPIFVLASMPAGDGARRNALAERVITWTDDVMAGGTA